MSWKTLPLAAVAALSVAGGAAAETIKFSHFVPTGHRVHHGVELWAASIKEASGGALDVRIFPAQQIGKAVDHYDMIARGVVEAAWFVPGYSAGRFPIIDAGELPFLLSDAAKGARAIHEWYAEHAAREMKEIRFCAVATHDPGRIHTREPVASVEAMNGVKLRPANATVGEYLSDLGAVPVKLAAPEARQGVSRGVVDGVTFPWNTVINFGLADDLKHHLDVALYVPMALYGVNPAFYESLAPELKNVLDDHCTPEWSEKLTNDWAGWEQEGRAALAGMDGHVITELSDAQLQPFREKAQGVYAAWRERAAAKYPDLDADAVLKALTDRLDAHGAGL